MLTIFATPKPFQGHVGIIQRNAIGSWVRLHLANATSYPALEATKPLRYALGLSRRRA